MPQFYTTEKLVKKLLLIHKDKYDYSKTIYIQDILIK